VIVRDDLYIRAQALKAALALTKMRLGEEPSARSVRELLNTDEVKATARVFEQHLRG